MPDDFHIYAGDGSTAKDRGATLSDFERPAELDSPGLYLADDGLRDAVNVALALDQPLLLTGDPGTGKTDLAGSVAHELGLPLVEFHAKTTSTARDLFYRYDALRHLRDAQARQENVDAARYIEFEALGVAILLSLPPAETDPLLPEKWRGRGPTRSVVLMDEIDKAPRDLPNDILVELEEMRFAVKETGREFMAARRFRPVAILTSNSEKMLPEAFLRRCVFYHIDFPGPEKLKKIAERRLGATANYTQAMLDNAVKMFIGIRNLQLTRNPSTAEFLSWFRILEKFQIDVDNLKDGQRELLAMSYAALAKTREDRNKIESGRRRRDAV